ncbi:MAG TPA: hypothetical protein VL547_02300 [Dinghuibacter sp.]|uniref:hypothetical protein n=1 Tax=Dinghuibacter sp. TaxID=2024697 RepID=UPI002D1864C8|nr:hypothetical protein [Dinghuibacter sp.]HTJ10823.1 hypothetical protein [Dinghuibacter sp.]
MMWILFLAMLQTVVVRPGSPLIRYDLVRSSHDFYRNTITDSSGAIRYDFMMEDFTVVDTARGRIVFARSRQVPPGSFSTDTSETDLWLRPVRMHEAHFQRGVSFDMTFGDTVASVRTLRNGVATVRNYPMQPGYFEDNMIEYIFGYVDWQKGVTYVLDNFNKDAPKPSDPYTIEYAFDDRLMQKTCTVLRFVRGSGTGYIWIDKATRKVLKQVGSFGSLNYVMVLE